ncbi:MAG: hypothetical protein QM761_13735 [Pseudoxanthomonas sp.]
MLYESQVVQAVAAWLASRGYEVHQALAESDRGDDIVATAPDLSHRLFVEAKGESSSKPGTARYGKVFSHNQVKTHIGVAFYRAAQMLDNQCDLPVTVAIALPDNHDHRRVIGRIRSALARLEISVFWVARDLTVSLEAFSADNQSSRA